MPAFSFEKITKPTTQSDDELIDQDWLEADSFRKGWFGFTNYGMPTLIALLVIAVCGTGLMFVGR